MSDSVVKKYAVGTVTVQRIGDRISFSFWPYSDGGMLLSFNDIADIMRTGNALQMQKTIADVRRQTED